MLCMNTFFLLIACWRLNRVSSDAYVKKFDVSEKEIENRRTSRNYAQYAIATDTDGAYLNLAERKALLCSDDTLVSNLLSPNQKSNA